MVMVTHAKIARILRHHNMRALALLRRPFLVLLALGLMTRRRLIVSHNVATDAPLREGRVPQGDVRFAVRLARSALRLPA